MIVIGIDPGCLESAVVIYDSERKRIDVHFKKPNTELLNWFQQFEEDEEVDGICIEMIASYGMAVGIEVFETCVWIGRFMEALKNCKVRRVYRKTIAGYICNDARAKDANIRQSLLDLVGPQKIARTELVDTKKGQVSKTVMVPGPTFGLKGDTWSALSIAIWASDNPDAVGVI